jgi:glucose dehydrogenase/mono/diheme cytochrome c family protein
MYVTSSLSRVYAIDAASGALRWEFDPHIRLGESTQNSYAARVNRGVAVWDGTVFVGTGDCRLVAIDATSGKERWQSPICDPALTGTTGAPHVARGNVVIGYNGSDDKVRGSIAAFDARTGKEVWRFWTVPADPATGAQSPALAMAATTWTGRGWSTVGGGDVWDPVTYDSTTGLLLFGTAGAGGGEGTTPGPIPEGDKLFSGCIVAVNPATGAYVWHFQTGAHDITSLLGMFPENMHIVVADLVIDGRPRHVAMTVPKSGIFYVLDATSGALISAKAIVDVPWAGVIDSHTGRVIGTPPSVGHQWTVHNWWRMSYSPRTGLVYVPVTDRRPGTDSAFEGKLIAWDPVRGAVRWVVEHPLAVNSSVLSTAGNLVFQGQGTGEFDAFAASDGRRLWSIQTGSAIDATPVSFMLHGEQYIIMPVGWGSASRLFGPASAMATPESKRGPARVLAFKLGATVPFPTPRDVVPAVPEPPRQPFAAAMVHQGEHLYETHLCSGCHSPGLDGSGAWTVDGAIPDLRYAPPDVHRDWRAIVLTGTHRAQGMLAFGVDQHFPEVSKLTPREADAIHAYVIDAAWKAYDEQQRQIAQARKRD